MTRVVFRRHLPTTIDAAWELLTDPARMNEWSVAPVEVTGSLDPREPGGERVVRVRRLGVPLALREYTVSAEPPRRYRYRVRPNVIVRRHIAEQRLSPDGDGVALKWEVEISSWIPGAMLLLVRLMRPQLEASLDRLVQAAANDEAVS